MSGADARPLAAQDARPPAARISEVPGAQAPEAPPVDSPSTELDAATRQRFGVTPEDAVRVVIAPDRRDPWLNFLAVSGLAGGPLALSWLIAWGYGDPRAPTALIGVVALALAVAVIAAVAGDAFGEVHAVTTDRGIHLRTDESDDPLVVPWDDVVSLESTFPFIAEYRMELRHDAPALEILKRHSTLMGRWKTRPNVRVIGSSSIWDTGGRRLEGMQEQIDRTVLRSVGASMHDKTNEDDQQGAS